MNINELQDENVLWSCLSQVWVSTEKREDKHHIKFF
jgi:sulfur transfer protein SufE